MNEYTFDYTVRVKLKADSEDGARHLLNWKFNRSLENISPEIKSAECISILENVIVDPAPTVQATSSGLFLDLSNQQKTPAPAHIKGLLLEEDLMFEEDNE
jgi:hypothetical protein